MHNEPKISEGIQTIEKIQISETNYQTIFNFISEAIFIHEIATGRIIDVNDAMLSIYGYESKDEIFKCNIGNLSANIAPFDEASAQKHLQKTLEDRPQTFDWIARRKNGTTFWVEVKLKKIQIDGTERILAVARDIDHRKITEKQLEKQAEELREINQMKDKFMSIIAHDLKSPFNAIMGFTELMLRNFDQLDVDDIIKGLKTIESASNHAYKLLENLLLWAKNQSGKLQFSPETLNLSTQIHKSILAIESVAINKNINIQFDIDREILVYADENMFDTVIRNLVSNAIKFSHRGSKIFISAIETKEGTQISIKDHGIGIKPERYSDLFEIARRSTTSGTEDEPGTGFGLILCNEFVNKHCGKIWFESTYGLGSIFNFMLPVN